MATLFDIDAPRRRRTHAKRMSTHLAVALLAITLLHIGVIARSGGSAALHLAAIFVIGGFAVGARRLERRWILLDAGGQPRRALAPRFRRDLLCLWGLGLATAFLWIPAAALYRALLG